MGVGRIVLEKEEKEKGKIAKIGKERGGRKLKR
jgi:hypothetical protein